MRAEKYQWTLIISFVLCVILGGYFLYKEIAPEYKIFQNDYVQLEEFRSSYTGESPPSFTYGVKQIVLARNDKGPEVIDRCISCHVALSFPHFSPTKIAYDINGHEIINEEGIPVKIKNEEYIWAKLDEKIDSLRNEQFNRQLFEQGKKSLVESRLKQADGLEALKTAEVEGRTIDMSKALAMHPLIGRETRPFEFHPMEQYGCTSCHNGNGRGLVMDKAHGPVLDGEYEEAFEGMSPQFTEPDPKNDPQFARVFNHKPGHELLFQTTPLFIGKLIEAKCVQCHQSTSSALHGAVHVVERLNLNKDQQVQMIKQGIRDDIQALISLMKIKQEINSSGYTATLNRLMRQEKDLTQEPQQLNAIAFQIKYLSQDAGMNRAHAENEEVLKKKSLEKIDQDLVNLTGSIDISETLISLIAGSEDSLSTIKKFYVEHQEQVSGSLFKKVAVLKVQEENATPYQSAEASFHYALDEKQVEQQSSSVDALTKTYQQGEGLFISQACYACHRISAFSRGGVGPELTRIGYAYPWYIKEKMVWPQGTLKTSTMPNMVLDHEELESLMTYLLGQTGNRLSKSPVQYKMEVSDWEKGQKMPWEQPIPADKIHDLRNSMIIFATEGCASCHRLKGFESNVAYRVEKEEKTDFATLYKKHEWFTRLFPEASPGSHLVEILETKAKEIDDHLVSDVRKEGVLEEIERRNPKLLEALYANFKYALRAKNAEYQEKAEAETNTEKKKEILNKITEWKERVHRVLMVYIQEYGLGRLIGPRLNWSGIFRSDQWLMDHFKNPTETSPRSLMPAFPFADSKFYALTYLLDTLGKRNRDENHALWEHRGFNPEMAFQIHCSQCHGDYKHGNGPVAQWIYPIPKNLTNATFLRNLTKERAIQSITHGVIGTPMPPWGEVAKGKSSDDQVPVLTGDEIKQLVEWLYFPLSGGEVIEGSKDVLKWDYKPEDVIRELEKEDHLLKSRIQKVNENKMDTPHSQLENWNVNRPILSPLFSTGAGFYAALNPMVSTPEENKSLTVEDIFDVKPPLVSGPEKHAYFIKQSYYTDENLQQGQQFFEMNCAACHGKEADGTGLRAESMSEAKPRMLINLNWINTRDDLRLLRSIKYGVPGTAMTPWGDFTSSLQRIQLVMFIRSLSRDHRLRNALSDQLYQSFGLAEIALDNERSGEYAALDTLSNQLEALRAKREALTNSGNKQNQENSDKDEKEAIALFQQEIELTKEYKKRQNLDEKLVELKKEIERESDFYRSLGLNLLLRKVNDEDFNLFLKLISLNQNHYQSENGKLKRISEEEQSNERLKLQEALLQKLEEKILLLNREKVLLNGKLPFAEKEDSLKKVTADLSAYTKLKGKFISDFAEIERSKALQERLFNEYSELNK